ncbi:hypothetical protein GGS20DRAFT_527281 [Poronia punctata]|nr:hypothetical protein GGS20DRAFT_527281 [Poronia punctata]
MAPPTSIVEQPHSSKRLGQLRRIEEKILADRENSRPANRFKQDVKEEYMFLWTLGTQSQSVIRSKAVLNAKKRWNRLGKWKEEWTFDKEIDWLYDEVEYGNIIVCPEQGSWQHEEWGDDYFDNCSAEVAQFMLEHVTSIPRAQFLDEILLAVSRHRILGWDYDGPAQNSDDMESETSSRCSTPTGEVFSDTESISSSVSSVDPNMQILGAGLDRRPPYYIGMLQEYQDHHTQLIAFIVDLKGHEKFPDALTSRIYRAAKQKWVNAGLWQPEWDYDGIPGLWSKFNHELGKEWFVLKNLGYEDYNFLRDVDDPNLYPYNGKRCREMVEDAAFQNWLSKRPLHNPDMEG